MERKEQGSRVPVISLLAVACEHLSPSHSYVLIIFEGEAMVSTDKVPTCPAEHLEKSYSGETFPLHPTCAQKTDAEPM